MAGYDELSRRLENIEEKIVRVCAHCGRNREEITLLAVSKFHPAEAVYEAYQAGLRIFGENRVQEAIEKFTHPLIASIRDDITLHFQGHLQSNKIKKALECFDCIQSLDSIELVEEIIKKISVRNEPLEVLFELHTAEYSKSGFLKEEDLLRALELVMQTPALIPRGLMTMAPYTTDTALIRASFQTCKKLFDKIQHAYKLPDFSVLSMGMSNDFEIAIEEGATMIRIGTALFGERTYG